MNTRNKFILAGALSAVAFGAYATDDAATLLAKKTVTSKNYVDTQVATKQNKIPAANTNSGTPGTSVVMYTGTAGTVGERGIYSGTSYTSGDANKLVTAASLNGTVAAIPSITTSKLECANTPDCTLWTISDQSVLGRQSSGN